MAQVVWLEPAELDLEEIAEYIALDDPAAADEFVTRVLNRVKLLIDHPRIGTVIPELPESKYRQLIVGPCRIFHRIEEDKVYIVHIRRSEQLFRPSLLDELDTEAS